MLQVVKVLAAATLAAASFIVIAQDVTHYQESGLAAGRDYVKQHFAERIDPFNGNLSLQFSDMVIPGNGGFDLSVQRSYNANAIGDTKSPFGRGWQIHFGKIAHRATEPCAVASARSLVLQLPDGSSQTFYRSNGFGGTSSSIDYLTTSLWKARCNPSAGMTVTSPEGTRYDMTEVDGAYWHASRITDRFGNYLDFTYVYNATAGYKVVSQISASDGRSVSFSYSGDKLNAIQGAGASWSYTVSAATDGSNQLTRVTPPAGGYWQYGYNGNLGTNPGSWAMNSVTHPYGGNVTYTYAFKSFMPGIVGGPPPIPVVASKNAGGKVWSYNYQPACSGSGMDTTTVTQPDAMGTITIVYEHYGYCSVGQGEVWKIGLLREKSSGNVQTETYSWSPIAVSNEATARPGYFVQDFQINRPLMATRSISRDGQPFTTTNSSFDSFGNPQSISESGTRSRSRTVGYFNNPSTWVLGLVEDENISGVGSIGRARHSTTGALLSESKFGVTTTYTYHSHGSVASMTTAKPATTTYSNYSRGVAQTENRPEGVTINRSVDSAGNVTSESDGQFNWGYGYDLIGRLRSIYYPTGSDASISWSTTSRSLTRSSYSETTQFDDFGRTESIARAGVTQTFQHDALGRETFRSLPGSGLGTTYTLDVLGRVKQEQSPAGTKNITYTQGDVSVSNERGHTTHFEFDRYGDPDEGFLAGIAAPEPAASITMSRNQVGVLLYATQNGVTRTYARNLKFFLTSISEPETTGTTFGRDGVGNMTSRLVDGKTVSYGYDGLNRLKSITGTGVAVTLGYNARSKVTSVSNGSAQRSYAYDSNGNMTQDSLTIDGLTFTVGYTHDSIDGLASITYPMGKGTVTYAPDAMGRPTRASPFASSVDHWPSGNLRSISFGNGIAQSFGENSRQLPSSISAGGIQLGLTYNYDGVGNVASVADSYGVGLGRTLTYDPIDRVKTASGPWGSGTINYDGKGNISSQTLGQYTINYDYSNNRVASITGSKAITMQYDGAGNMTSKGVATFGYDPLSQMTCANCGTGNEISYKYDGQGRRVSEDRGGRRTYFVQAPNGDLQFEYATWGKVWTVNAYLHGKRIASDSGSDALASTTTLGASPTSTTYGGSVSLTASVSPSATGTMQFRAGDVLIGTGNLAGSQASMSTSNLAVGTHSITAVYSGDANLQPSTSLPVSVTVAKRNATVVASATPVSVNLGNTVALSATVAGSSPTGQVQFKDGAAILGNTNLSGGSASMTSPALTAGSHSFTGTYLGDANHNVAVSNAVGVTVAKGTPTVTVGTSNGMVVQGAAVMFTANLQGVPAFTTTGTVTFLGGGASIGTATVSGGVATLTTSSLSVGTHSISASYAGDSNYNAVTSAAISQTVLANTPRLSNISTRAQVLTGNEVMIGGFVIGGSSSKTVVVRARGPSLIPYGIANALGNPFLQLVRSSDQVTVAANDDWQAAGNAAAIAASGFAPSHSLESAALVTLAPGAYTAIVSGSGGSTGLGILEAYEVDRPDVPITNLSTRAMVLTGNDLLIGGFVVDGNAPLTVVVRARGPSLIPFGISNALANPTLQLVRSSDQATIAINDDWQSAPNAAQITASGFAPSHWLESAILVTLNPGAYTAIVSGVGGGTGVGIVEVFKQ